MSLIQSISRFLTPASPRPNPTQLSLSDADADSLTSEKDIPDTGPSPPPPHEEEQDGKRDTGGIMTQKQQYTGGGKNVQLDVTWITDRVAGMGNVWKQVSASNRRVDEKRSGGRVNRVSVNKGERERA